VAVRVKPSLLCGLGRFPALRTLDEIASGLLGFTCLERES
jgi:hypothetical protein